jgi:hypothetical protein
MQISRSKRRAASHPATMLESFEARRMLSASPGLAPAPEDIGGVPVVTMEWRGQKTRALKDTWVIGLSEDFRKAHKGEKLSETAQFASRKTFGLGNAEFDWSSGRAGSHYATLVAPFEQAKDVERWVASVQAFRFVAPSGVADVFDVPLTEPDFDLQWGMWNTGQNINGQLGTSGADVDAPGAWDNGSGSGIIIAVIDTGIDTDHPDLDSRIELGGWDYIGNDSNVNHDASDTLGHGTLVAGAAVAERNAVGVLGMSYNAKVLPMRVGTGGLIFSEPRRRRRRRRHRIEGGREEYPRHQSELWNYRLCVELGS